MISDTFNFLLTLKNRPIRGQTLHLVLVASGQEAFNELILLSI
jgi:hypothetical protein